MPFKNKWNIQVIGYMTCSMYLKNGEIFIRNR